jgi:O-antigen/teichoic acid export membrane protein
MKFDKKQIVKNVGSSWFSLGVNVLVGIFLSPFIMHRLGDTAFGIWVLIFSVTGYYGIFDLGIRSSVIRYVSKFTATGETEQLAGHINTSLATYTGIGALAMTVTLFISYFADQLLKVPPGMHSQARLLLLLAGASVSLGFPLGISGGILEGLQRYYLLNWTAVAMSLTRAALIVFFLHRGYGLTTIVLITVLLPILMAIIRGMIVMRLMPIPYGLKYIHREAFRQMAHFSGATMVIIVAAQMRFQTDSLIIGRMLSAAAITYFTVASRPTSYAFQFVVALAQVFVPMSSQSEAVGNLDRVRKMYIAGNRACAFIILPISATLLILGKSVIEVWVGAKYVPLSYPTLVILTIPMTLMMMQGASGRILIGLGKHRQWAAISLIEGIANVILSVALVRPLGIEGDALGTAIPLAFSMLYFFPRHMKKQLGVRVRTFLREAYTLPLLLILPFISTLLLMRRWFYAHHLWQLVIQAGVAAAVYGVGLLWAYKTKRILEVGELTEKKMIEAVAVEPVPALQNEEV